MKKTLNFQAEEDFCKLIDKRLEELSHVTASKVSFSEYVKNLIKSDLCLPSTTYPIGKTFELLDILLNGMINGEYISDTVQKIKDAVHE